MAVCLEGPQGAYCQCITGFIQSTDDEDLCEGISITCIRIYIHIYIHTHMHTYIYIHLWMHVLIYTRIHTMSISEGLFHSWLRFITFGGRSAHLVYHVHKSGHKISIIIIVIIINTHTHTHIHITHIPLLLRYIGYICCLAYLFVAFSSTSFLICLPLYDDDDDDDDYYYKCVVHI